MTNAARYLTRPAGAALAGLLQPLGLAIPFSWSPVRHQERLRPGPVAPVPPCPDAHPGHRAVAARDGAHSFDAPGAEFTHRYDQCTFEVLIDAFNLAGDLALVRLARIVHAADIAADLASDPLGLGLLAIGEGGLDVEADDQRLLDRGMFVYDACMPVEGSPQDGGLGMRRRPADTEAKMSHRADANGGNGLHRHRHLGGRPPRAGRVLDTLDSQHAVQLRAATLLRLSEHLQAPERGGRLMITVDGPTPLPTTELDDYLVVCKEFPDAGAALGRHLAWELGSDDATAVLSRAEAWIGERLRNQPAPGRMRDLAAALAVMVREGGGLPVAERDYQRQNRKSDGEWAGGSARRSVSGAGLMPVDAVVTVPVWDGQAASWRVTVLPERCSSSRISWRVRRWGWRRSWKSAPRSTKRASGSESRQ